MNTRYVVVLHRRTMTFRKSTRFYGPKEHGIKTTTDVTQASWYRHYDEAERSAKECRRNGYPDAQPDSLEVDVDSRR